MSAILKELRDDFWGAWGRWQDRRPLWLMGGGIALFLEIFSWAFFQTFLGLLPCELCVYIRFSMLGIFAGAMIGALRPSYLFFKLGGYALAWWWVVQGLIWNIRLEIENIRAADPNHFSLCGPTASNFPFGLKLDQWFPAHFRPEAICGEPGNAWSLLGLNMSEWLFFIYGGFIAVLSLMVVGGLVQARRRRQR